MALLGHLIKGKTYQETKKKLDKHCGDSAPAIKTVYKWFHNYWSGHRGTSAVEHFVHRVRDTTLEIIDVVMDDGRIKVL
uniref:Mos1 transposase HTH domain-containing protein n=1 Tax=Lepeophtheirus salmonis TaxID=72036 RepID=A0A0K2UBE3_LEPSM